jgi:hypothetical protein
MIGHSHSILSHPLRPSCRAYFSFYTGYYYHIPKLHAKVSYSSLQNSVGEDEFLHKTILNEWQL